MDYYLNRFKSKVSSVAAQVTQALPGNPVFREYDVHEQVASAGPGLAWKIYSGTKNSTKQSVSIWLFEKRQIEKWPKHEKEAFPELLKRGVAQLTRLRHPRLLVVERALEESRETFAFCTEPIFASLANVFTQTDSSVQSHLQDFTFVDVEIRHGLFQLSEALKFLHNDAKILHGNVCPASVVINDRGAWKLAGFDFCVLSTPLPTGQVTFEINEWDRRLMSCMSPELDYAAPELVGGIKCDTYADIFSLGVLAGTLFNDNRPFFECKGLLDDYQRNVEKLKALNIDVKHRIPEVFRADLKACLNVTPELRPDAIQMTKIAYFDDSLLKIFLCLDSLMQMDNSQKMMFFKGLTAILSKFSKRPLLQKVFPYLSAELSNADLVPFILPNIFAIAEQATNKEFASVIFPPLIPVFAAQRPYQTVLLLLQNIPLFLQKTPDTDVRKHVLPLIYNSISSENTRIQELCLSIIPTIGKLVDREAMRSQLLPKLLRIVVDASVLSIRVQTLVCLSKLMVNLEPWMVADQIIPALPKINSKEPAVLMAVLGVYKLAFETEKFGISTDQCAKSVMPFLVSSCVETSLNLQQFEQYSFLIHKMLTKVEQDQRQRLTQLSAAQEEQRNIDFNEILNASASGSSSSAVPMDANLSSLNGALFGAADSSANSGDSPFDFGALSATTATAALGRNKSSLSLEEKKRLAAEQERSQRSTPTDLRRTAAKTAVDLFAADFNSLAMSLSTRTAKNNNNNNGNGLKSPPTLNLDDFAAWTMPNDADKSASGQPFANFPQPPPSSAGNLVQRPGGKTSLDDLLGNFGATTKPPAVNSVGAGSGPSLFPATMMAPQAVQPTRSSAPNFQSFIPLIAGPPSVAHPTAPAKRVVRDPFDDLLR